MLMVICLLIGCKSEKAEEVKAEKPVIYLYPEQEMEARVSLKYDGELICVYPAFDEKNLWKVKAVPEGILTDLNGQEYNYLYWEGKTRAKYDFSTGYCVKGENTAKFLEEKLEALGLTRREANEFIVYWLPQMEKNPYNVISFQTMAYMEKAELNIEPEPDTVIRVFMAWYGTAEKIEMIEPLIVTPERKGFTVVEWGGSESRASREFAD